MVANDKRRIAIIGAGIIGLDVAWTLVQQGYGNDITVVAEHLPGDLAIGYVSPLAGANFSAISGSDGNALRWDKISYPLLLAMADDPGQPYVERTESFEFWDERPPEEKIDSMVSYLKAYQVLDSSYLPHGAVFGVSFTTVTVNAPAHIAHLRSLLESQYGVRFVRRRLSSLKDVFKVLPSASIVFNCTGGAAEIFSEDPQCYPTRGQILVARAPAVTTNVMRHGRDYETYIIPRPNSGSQVVLGGYMQKGVRTEDVSAEESESIRQRTGSLMPTLLNGDVDIINAVAGLRPSRRGGARVEKEYIGEGKTVIHNYGAGGTGFQAGMGMALDAVSLASQSLEMLRSESHL